MFVKWIFLSRTSNIPEMCCFTKEGIGGKSDISVFYYIAYLVSVMCGYLWIYLVDISKRSLTELTLQLVAPQRSSSCSQSEADSNQFMWASRRRLLRNCFISVGGKWLKHSFWCSRHFKGARSGAAWSYCDCFESYFIQTPRYSF